MPFFCYITEDGQRREERLVKPGRRPPRTIRIAGRRAYRDYKAEKGGTKGDLGLYPRYSNAIRYDPKYKRQFSELMAANGTHGELNGKGQAKIESNQHFNEVLKALELRDKDACYRQHAGT